MAALSDYLEAALLNHIFKDQEFSKPTTIAIALTSGVPLDSDTGETLPELPSGIGKNDGSFVNTNYKRLDLGDPSTEGNTIWDVVGIDNTTAFQIYGTSTLGDSAGESGYFSPLYLTESAALNIDPTSVIELQFEEFPGTTLYAPSNTSQLASSNNPNLPAYDGNGFIKNKSQLVFDTALQDWGWVSGVAILDNAEYGQGNLLMYSELSNPRYVYTGDNIKFDNKSLEINIQ